MQEKVTLEDIQKRIVFGVKVAHVTFYLVESDTSNAPEGYFVYSESKDRGLKQILSDDPRIEFSPMAYLEAARLLEESMRRFEDLLEKKRRARPSPQQLYYFFCNRIPIPINLTWGDAYDLIASRVTQEKQEKAEKYDGFTVGQRITCQFSHPERQESGTITKLTIFRGTRYMHVQYDNGRLTRWPFATLPKIL